MAKKKKEQDEDIFFDEGSGAMAMYDGYKEIEVSSVLNTLNGKAKKYISDLIEFYTTIKPTAKEGDQDALPALYDASIADSKVLMKSNYEMEANMLANMLLSLRTSQHILQTLLIQFNNGGYMDEKATEKLIQFTKQNIAITKDVTSYKRAIRTEIKDLRNDITQYSSATSREEMDNLVNNGEQSEKKANSKSNSMVQRGTKDINEIINKAVREKRTSPNHTEGFEEAHEV